MFAILVLDIKRIFFHWHALRFSYSFLKTWNFLECLEYYKACMDFSLLQIDLMGVMSLTFISSGFASKIIF